MVRTKFAIFKVQMTYFLTCITQLSTGSVRTSVVGTEGLRSPTEFQIRRQQGWRISSSLTRCSELHQRPKIGRKITQELMNLVTSEV